ncbi:MAG: ion channel [Methanotrichaceae archaeon]
MATSYDFVHNLDEIGFELGEVKANIWDAFYFSMMTFTTVGYGDWYPWINTDDV